jgi:phage/plasmid-like protein (TIGR03299 family)
MDILTGEGRAKYETAMSLRGGKIVAILARMPRKSDTPDPVENYLLCRTSHDGSTAVEVCFTGVRVVCMNTLQMALQGAKNTLVIRHTKSAKEKMDAAQKTLSASLKYFEEMDVIFDSMKQHRFGTDQLIGVVKHAFKFSEKEIEDGKKDRKLTRDANVLSKVLELAESGKGTEIPGVKGTAWGGYNAITEYCDHHSTVRIHGVENETERDNKEFEQRFTSNIWGSSADVKQSALEKILSIIGWKKDNK